MKVKNSKYGHIAVPIKTYNLVVNYCKNRQIPIPVGAWVAQAILEKIEREKNSIQELQCQNQN